MKLCGVYKIESLIKPTRVYVGSSHNIHKRWNEHLRKLRKNIHHSKKLQNHFNKYGKNDLTFSVLICCNESDLVSTEQFFIDSLSPWFNSAKIAGRVSGLHWKLSPETREKMRQATLGHKRNVGHKHSEETKIKMGLKSKGHKCPEYVKERLSELAKQRRHSEETKIKIGLAARNISEETREKLRARSRGENNPMYGRVFTEEEKKKRIEKARATRAMNKLSIINQN